MRAPRTVGVVAKTTLSPNMCRLRLGGKALADFPGGFEGRYVKLIFPGSGERPTVRSYAVREFSPERQLTIDMVAHVNAGPAADWAAQVQPGARIDIAGPARAGKSTPQPTGSCSPAT